MRIFGNKYHKRFFLLVLVIVLGFFAFSKSSYRQNRSFVLSGSFHDGIYTKTAKSLQKYLQQKFSRKYKFTTHNSAGSIENIRDLDNNESQICLIQEDVAHYFYNGDHKLLKIAHRRTQAKALCFLFQEYLIVLAKPGKDSLQKLRKVNIGSFYGGSGVTAINLKEEFQYDWIFDTGDPVTSFATEEVDAILTITSNPTSIIERLQKEKLEFIPISLKQEEILGLTASFPFYQEAVIPLPRLKNTNIHTISIRALLGVHKRIPTEIAEEIINIFIEPEMYQNFSRKCPEIRNIEKGIEEAPKDRRERFGKFPIPMHPLIFELQRGKPPYVMFVIMTTPLLIICAVIIYLKRHNRYKVILANRSTSGVLWRNIFREAWIYVFLISAVFLYIIIAIYAIKYLEVQAFIRSEVSETSRILDMEFSKLFTWIFVFTVAGYENEIFPTTELGKIVASSIRVVAISCIMFIFGRLSADYITNLIKGRKMHSGYNLTNHVVICNWNPKGEKIVEEIHSPLLKEHGMARPIIVICNHEITFPDTDAFEDTFLIPGDPTSIPKLRNANVHQAFSIIILADERLQEADANTIMIAMEVSELCDAAEDSTQKPHICAELLEGKNVKYLKRAGIDEVISGNDLGVKLLAQSAVTPGITAFMDNILEYSSKTNEIYIVEPPAKLVKEKADFAMLSLYFLQNRFKYYSAILVGIQREGEMLVNPEPSEFNHLTAEDRLVVLAKRRPKI